MNNKTGFTHRNLAIDILRALTMLLMIFVNDLWSIQGEPEWLGHAIADQDFMGLADIVFPCFLFVVGMSIPFAIESRFSKGKSGESTVGHILTRTFALLIMGVFIVNTEYGVSAETGMNLSVYRILMVTGFFLIWNVYPRTENKQTVFRILKWVGIALLIYLGLIFRDKAGEALSTRWWGILGLIGWTYLICAMIYVFTRDRLKYLIPAWLILVVICIIKSRMNNGDVLISLSSKNLLDQALSILHIGNGCLPAFTMGGIILSLISTRHLNSPTRKKLIMGIAGTCGLLFLGYISHQFWIVSKLQATPPWLFYCSAIAVGTYTLLSFLVDKGKSWWFNIISPAGTATLTCYLIPYVAYSLSSLLGIKLPEFLTTGFPGILNSITFSFMIVGLTWVAGKLHIKFKI